MDSSNQPLLHSSEKGKDAGAGSRWAFANIAAFAVNATLVYVSNLGVIGRTNKEISDSITTLVTPPPYAFAIWGIIFSSEAAFIVWQALPGRRGSPAIVDGVGPWFAIACLLQAVWTVLFAQELISASAVALVGIAVSLALAVRGLAPYKAGTTAPEAFLLHFPIGLHAGWVCAAALVNVNLALVSSGVGTSGQVTAAILSVFGAAAAAWTAAACWKDPAFLLAVVWALGSISTNGSLAKETLGSEAGAGFSNAVACIATGLVAAELGRLVAGHLLV